MHELNKALEIIQEQAKIIDKQFRFIERLIDKGHQRVHLSLGTIVNNSKYLILMAQLNQGQFSLDFLQLIDSDTQAPVQATFANQVYTSDNAAVLTTELDTTNPNQTKNTAVAPGTANVTATADCTYTDSKTQQPVTKNLSVTVPYTVVAVTAGENVALQLIQGKPQG